MKTITLLSVLLISTLLQGCAMQVAGSVASATVGVVAGTAIGVAKVPFQVGGAVIDAVSDSDEE